MVRERIFYKNLENVVKSIYSQILYEDNLHTDTIGSMWIVKEVGKAYVNNEAIYDEAILSKWAARGAEDLGTNISVPTSGKTFEALRTAFAEQWDELVDDLAEDDEEPADYHLKEKSLVDRWLDTSEIGDFLFWLLSYYVEETVIEWVRDNSLEILDDNVRNPSDVAQKALETFCEAFTRLHEDKE